MTPNPHQDLALLAARVCGARAAVLGVVEGEGLKARAWIGLTAPEANAALRLPGHLLAAQDVFVVEDAGPGIRFLAGLPFRAADGALAGVLCVLDRVPRDLGAESREALEALARQASAQAEMDGQVRAVAQTLAEVAEAEETLRRTMASSQRITRALGESEARIRTIVESIADGLITFSEGGAIETYNPASERIFGHPPSAVIGRSIEMLISGPIVELKDGFHAEATGRRADGTPVPVDLSISQMSYEDRHSFIAIVRDVSAQKRAERRRATEHEVARILAESLAAEDAVPRILETLGKALRMARGAYWTIDRESHALRCSAVWPSAETTGPSFPGMAMARESSFARGVGLPGRVWESGAPEWIADVSQHPASSAGDPLTTGIGAAFAFPVALGKEVLGVMGLSGARVAPADDEVMEMAFSLGGPIAQLLVRDEADRALRASDEQTRAIMENMLEGLITINAKNVIEHVNPAAEQMFGYAAWELVGQHLRVLMPRSSAVQPDAFLRDAAKRALGHITEWDGRRKNGELFRFELSLFAFETPDGRHCAGHIRDVSERKKLERMKKEFVATVSHELRTPLTSIRGSLGLLSGGALGDLSDEVKDVVTIAERNTVRLIGLINDILDLERLESGPVDLKLAPTACAEVLQRSVESVSSFAEQQGIELRVPPCEAVVFADADRLVQVLVNLLSNAVKFSPRGSAVTVSVEGLEREVEIRVADRGRGIRPEDLDMIFERFKQVEASDARQKGGTGLGLAICKAIIEQHGGSIGVESTPGAGSTFWFRVPSKTAAEGAGGDRLLEARASDLPADALLVDDDSTFLGVLTRQLLHLGIPVRTAGTAAEAIAEARRVAPALLVLDVGLPDGDGFGVIEALRRDPNLAKLAVLVYCARDLDEPEKERLTLGTTRFLTKSRASGHELKAAVLELLQRETGARR